MGVAPTYRLRCIGYVPRRSHTPSIDGYLHHPCCLGLSAGYHVPLGECAPHPTLCRGLLLYFRELLGRTEAGRYLSCWVRGDWRQGVDPGDEGGSWLEPCVSCRGLWAQCSFSAAPAEQSLHPAGRVLWGSCWDLLRLLCPPGASALRQWLFQCKYGRSRPLPGCPALCGSAMLPLCSRGGRFVQQGWASGCSLPVPYLEQVSRDRNSLDIGVLAGSTVGCQAAWVFALF